MRFKIDVKNANGGWEVRVTNSETDAPVIDAATGEPFTRLLRSVGEGLDTFPQPPKKEADEMPAPGNPHRDLCITEDADLIANMYQDILRRRADKVLEFGRYLFATMLGDALWDALNDLAKTEPLELALTWHNDDNLINRLPWELMHSKDNFLAAEPEVSITRRVAGTTQTLGEISSPRVLFVVGSDLAKDPNIRPGAEYLGLLRSLKPANRLRLKTHLLLQASPKRIRSAIKWFRPTVVHFICHGSVNAQRESRLQLMNDDGTAPEQIDAGSLFKLLRPEPDSTLPQIVVLNACYTATDNPKLYLKSGQIASPMAVKLIEGDEKGGVPIVVGMAGQIADQACRLFTRCFYQAILGCKEIAQAAAAGRRMGIIDEGLTDPKTSVDWAMPTLFMSEGVKEPKFIIKSHEREPDWHEIASEFAPPSYPAFCDRLEFFQWFDYLMAQSDAELPPPQYHSGDLQTIAISVDGKNKKEDNVQLGRTWLLREFAAQAVLDGHLPCLVNIEWINRDKNAYPGTFNRLIEDFKWAIDKTSQLFDLKFSTDCLNLLRDVEAGKKPAENLPADVQNLYKLANDYNDPRVVSVALRIDLLHLLERARLQRPEEERARTKLLLLVDDVHQMDEAIESLLELFFSSPYGLRSTSAETPNGPTAKADIRVICTYDKTMGLEDKNTFTDWPGSAKGAKELPLGVFQPPEDGLAYEFFLSRWRNGSNNDMPLSIHQKAPPEFVQNFFTKLSKSVEGIPSKLKSGKTSDLIDIYLDLPVEVLRKTNDEDRLKLIPMLKRGA